MWALKDPRLCLFVPAWRQAARAAGSPLAAVFMARHPDEVARSLAARDGIAHGRGLLLWLDYTISALAAMDGMDAVVLDYPSLLADWRQAIARVARLPGMAALQPDAGAAAIDAYLEPGKRHQRSNRDDASLPEAVAQAWGMLRTATSSGRMAQDEIRPLHAGLLALRELARPVLAEGRQQRAAIWLRAGRAEAALAEQALGMPAELQALREGIDSSQTRIVDAISAELRRMQEVASGFQAAAAQHQLEVVEARAGAAAAEAVAADAQAAAAAAQRDLMHARYELVQLESSAREYQRILASRSWRWTRPIRVLGRMLRGELGDADRLALDRLLGRKTKVAAAAAAAKAAAPATSAAAAPTLQPATARVGMADVFVWSVIDWYFRFQRPQHLAEALAAKGHRVFYISNNFNDAATPGFHAEPLDAQGRLFQLRLNLAGAPSIYAGMPTDAQVEALRASLACVLDWAEVETAISLAQHPFWKPLLRAVPDARLVYDCMDHHGGFADNVPAVIEAEAALVAGADLVVVTSGWLCDELRTSARSIEVIRNAGEYDFFSKPPAETFRDPRGRKIIGYYGAIAEWFDAALVRQVAEANPGALVVLVGRDTAGAGARLSGLDNVHFVGEVAYGELPYWLHAFDVCMLPFEVIPLTLATNPVKVYEYLAAGKPVVSVDLPEMAQFDGLVAVAGDSDSFVAAVGAALAGDDRDAAGARQAFAASQTWAHRAAAFDAALAGLPEPKVSVIVLAWNNLEYTQRCLGSIESYSGYRNLEVIAVDNASTDGSRDWLRQWAEEASAAGHRRRLILNDENLGFSAGNNVGLRAATGDVLVILNNDTHVTPGWVRGLCNHLHDPALGLVGPVTNNIGNEAKIDIAYDDMQAMMREAARYTRAHPGERIPIRTAAFFCVAMRRDTFERVGGMDESFGVGFFEDDDYCRRVEQAGLRVACAEDVFVHHHLSASFDALGSERKRALFEANKAIYEAKWGPWVPHGYRA